MEHEHETGLALSLSPTSIPAGLEPVEEARSVDSSPQGEAYVLQLSPSEEEEAMSIETYELSPCSPVYEELVEVVTRAVAKLNNEWPADKRDAHPRSKLDEWFLKARLRPPIFSGSPH